MSSDDNGEEGLAQQGRSSNADDDDDALVPSDGAKKRSVLDSFDVDIEGSSGEDEVKRASQSKKTQGGTVVSSGRRFLMTSKRRKVALTSERSGMEADPDSDEFSDNNVPAGLDPTKPISLAARANGGVGKRGHHKNYLSSSDEDDAFRAPLLAVRRLNNNTNNTVPPSKFTVDALIASSSSSTSDGSVSAQQQQQLTKHGRHASSDTTASPLEATAAASDGNTSIDISPPSAVTAV